jgi:type IV secretory pathway VirB2 component (pilin)
MLHATVLHAFDVLAQVPNPGSGSKPPGSEGITKILGWAAWVAFALCVMGVIAAGAMMAISSRRGEGGEHVSRLGYVFGGCIIIGSASALVGALV